MEWNKVCTSIRIISEENHDQSGEARYYITSVNDPPQRLMEVVRPRWKIESMHCMLDVVFSEDECSPQDEEAQLTMNSFKKWH